MEPAYVWEKFAQSIGAHSQYDRVHADDYKGWPVTMTAFKSTTMDFTTSGQTLGRTTSTRTEIEVALEYSRDFIFSYTRRPWYGVLFVAASMKVRRSAMDKYPPSVRELVPFYYVEASDWRAADQLLLSTAFWDSLLRRNSGKVTLATHEGDEREDKTLRYTLPGFLTTRQELAAAFDLVVRLVETMGDWLPEDKDCLA